MAETKAQTTYKSIVTDSGEKEFEILYDREECVGLFATRSGKNYLILDSLDYWYDVTQGRYPSKKKCSCKNNWFTAEFEYERRESTDDFRSVTLHTACTHCGKQTVLGQINIKYSPTRQLYDQPLTFCEKPKIKYKLFSASMYWEPEDLLQFTSFLYGCGANAYCFYWDNEAKLRFFRTVTEEELNKIVLGDKTKILKIFFSASATETSGMIAGTDEKGVYIDSDVWRTRELIAVNGPLLMAAYGGVRPLYSINFCEEYLDKGTVKKKSVDFSDFTKQLVEWMGETYATERGKNCFDGHAIWEEMRRYFKK